MQTQETQALLSLPNPLCSLIPWANLGRGSWYHDKYGPRHYWVYTPYNYQVGTVVPLIMILHGCLQDIATHPCFIASAAHMNQLADTQQFIVVYPHIFAPPADFNATNCWNFFLAANQYRDSGEPESLDGIVQRVLKNPSWTIDQQRIYVAGISSGGCLAVILGATYPDLFAAIGVHSGGEYGLRLPFVPLGEAEQAPGAVVHPSEAQALSGEVEERLLAVFRPGPPPIEQGKKAFDAMGRFARVVPTIVFHGTDDHVSDPENGDQVTQQWLYTNQLASNGTFKADFKHPSSTTTSPAEPPSPAEPYGKRAYTVFRWRDDQGHDVVTYWKINGLGHAWSGGTPGVPFTDPSGPDASKAFYEFFMAHLLPQPTGARMLVSRRPEEMVSVTTTQVTPTSLTVVKASPGRLCKVLVTTANGENAINIFDNASAASGTIIGVVAANASVGTIYDLQMPAAHGITIAGTASAGTITVSYS